MGRTFAWMGVSPSKNLTDFLEEIRIAIGCMSPSENMAIVCSCKFDKTMRLLYIYAATCTRGFHAAHTSQLPVPDFITLAPKRSRLAVRMITVVIMSLVS